MPAMSEPRSPTDDLTLLRVSEPVLRFTKGEYFYPVAVDNYVAHAALWTELVVNLREGSAADRAHHALQRCRVMVRMPAVACGREVWQPCDDRGSGAGGAGRRAAGPNLHRPLLAQSPMPSPDLGLDPGHRPPRPHPPAQRPPMRTGWTST
jgi:hypothetical protein